MTILSKKVHDRVRVAANIVDGHVDLQSLEDIAIWKRDGLMRSTRKTEMYKELIQKAKEGCYNILQVLKPKKHGSIALQVVKK